MRVSVLVSDGNIFFLSKCDAYDETKYFSIIIVKQKSYQEKKKKITKITNLD